MTSEFQASCTVQGKAFEDRISALIKANGFTPLGPLKLPWGVDVDQVFQFGDHRLLIELKGGELHAGRTRPAGLCCTSNVGKAIGNAALIVKRPNEQIWFVGTAVPRTSTAAYKRLARAKVLGIVDHYCDEDEFEYLLGIQSKLNDTYSNWQI